MTDIKVNPRNHLQVTCAEKTVNFGNCCTPFEFYNVNPGLIQADKLQSDCYLIEECFWFCKTRLVPFDFVTKTDNLLYNNN